MHGFGKARLSQQDLPPDFVPALEAAWARGGTRANAQDCAQLLVSIARLATPMVSDDSDDDMRDEDHMASPPESHRTLFGKAAVLPSKQRPLQHRVDSVELNLSRMAKEKPARASIIFESTKWAA